MLQVLKNRELLCIMGDRSMGGEGSTVTVDFLGGPVKIPFSPYKLASATGAPVAVIFPYRSTSGAYELHVAKTIRIPENLGRSADAYLPFAREFIAALEAFVTENPYQFYNFYDMWSLEE